MYYRASLLALCFASLAAGPGSLSAAQTPSRASGDWVVPRTPEGHPDLQGNWVNGTLTPFQRAEDRGPVFTQDEVDRRERGAVDQIARGAAPSDPDRPPLAAGGSIGSYNDVYFERGLRVAVINGEPRSSLLTHPVSGRRPSLTPGAQRRLQERSEFRDQFGAFDNPENRSLIERCFLFASNAGPPMVPNGAYNNNYTIVQTADYVMIHPEVVHDTRIIRLGQPDLPPAHIRQWLGYSWGRWEGDVLVVETTNFHPMQDFRGIPPTDDLKVIERFSRVDQETILYEFTIDDPTTYTEPWGGQIPMRALDEQLYEYACHEGNYALSNILRGARYQERMEAR